MSNLSPCPICGKSEGYELCDGSTFRWWSVRCVSCGTEVAECRSDGTTRIDAPKPATWPWADEEWNNAGAHAQSLRTRLAAADKLAKALRDVMARGVVVLDPASEQAAISALAEWEKLQ